jgi:hypothetical protein
MVGVTAFNDLERLRRVAFTPFSSVCCMKEFDLDFPVRMHSSNDGLRILTRAQRHGLLRESFPRPSTGVNAKIVGLARIAPSPHASREYELAIVLETLSLDFRTWISTNHISSDRSTQGKNIK